MHTNETYHKVTVVVGHVGPSDHGIVIDADRDFKDILGDDIRIPISWWENPPERSGVWELSVMVRATRGTDEELADIENDVLVLSQRLLWHWQYSVDEMHLG